MVGFNLNLNAEDLQLAIFDVRVVGCVWLVLLLSCHCANNPSQLYGYEAHSGLLIKLAKEGGWLLISLYGAKAYYSSHFHINYYSIYHMPLFFNFFSICLTNHCTKPTCKFIFLKDLKGKTQKNGVIILL